MYSDSELYYYASRVLKFVYEKIYHTKYLSTYHNITEIKDFQIYRVIFRNTPLLTPKCR